MRALVFDSFGGPLEVREVPAPEPPPGGVVVRVAASGICRSDWHAWQGHDPDVVLPHVPGHELAGTVAAVGTGRRAAGAVGDRVTVPFVNACGTCAQCAAGEHQVCARQTQPGFTHWGSLAEFVALDAADVNLVAVPDELDLATAAALGCRYATAFRAVVQVGAGAGRRVGGGARLRRRRALRGADRGGGRRPGGRRRRLARRRWRWPASSAPSTRWTARADVPGGDRRADRRGRARLARRARRGGDLRELDPQPAARAAGTCRSACCRRRRAARRCRWSG